MTAVKTFRGQQLHHSDAILLKTTVYGEADLILVLFSPGYGLIKGFARAAKKSIKRFGGSLSLFSTSNFSFKEGQGDLKVVSDAELVSFRNNISADMHCFATASYGVELIEMLLVAEEPNPGVYRMLTGFLDYLNQYGNSAFAKLLFELRLVEALGFLPHLLHCSECYADIGQQREVAFDVSRGGALCSSCGYGYAFAVNPGTLGSLSRCLRGPYDIFIGFKFSSRTLSEGTMVLSSVYRQILPKEPKTLKFMAQLGAPRS